MRFSPDKSPYKQNLGIVFWIGSGKKVELPLFYLHVEADRAFFYGGQHVFPKAVLERYRAGLRHPYRQRFARRFPTFRGRIIRNFWYF